jgi:hypothetical protein
MPALKNARSKLLKSGFLPQVQEDSYESWINTGGPGTISFFKRGDIIETFKVHGREPDRPEFDEFSSYYTTNLSVAIRISKL